jgi:hypothetical protein
MTQARLRTNSSARGRPRISHGRESRSVMISPSSGRSTASATPTPTWPGCGSWADRRWRGQAQAVRGWRRPVRDLRPSDGSGTCYAGLRVVPDQRREDRLDIRCVRCAAIRAALRATQARPVMPLLSQLRLPAVCAADRAGVSSPCVGCSPVARFDGEVATRHTMRHPARWSVTEFQPLAPSVRLPDRLTDWCR